MVNEVLCKILCHNLCSLIQEQCSLGIESVFWPEENGEGQHRAFLVKLECSWNAGSSYPAKTRLASDSAPGRCKAGSPATEPIVCRRILLLGAALLALSCLDFSTCGNSFSTLLTVR